MPIRFACERCGHPFEVDDRLAGKLGRCKHCGYTAPIPGPPAESPSARPVGLKLRPLDEEAAGDAAEPGPAADLRVRPVPPEDVATAHGLDPGEDEAGPPSAGQKARVKAPYHVLDPDRHEEFQAKPFHLNPHYETRLARFVARNLRKARDVLFVASVGFLLLAGYGFAVSDRRMLHIGSAGVVAGNIGMLAVSMFYLVTIPFEDSLARGLGTLLVPPYAVYYWVSHWPRMRKPVLNTLRSFTPIAAVGLAYLLYVEAPVIKGGVEKVEKVVEKQGEALERLADPGDGKADTPPAPERVPRADPAAKTGPPPF